MKIQEALTKIKELKADAAKLMNEAARKKTRTVYLDVPEERYKKPKGNIEPVIDNAIELLAEAHELKLAVQLANADHGLVNLIQESDLLKSLCAHFQGYEGIEKESDPSFSSFVMRSTTNPAFEIQQANFDTDRMDESLSRWRDRIREINQMLQDKNWKVDIDLDNTGLEIRNHL